MRCLLGLWLAVVPLIAAGPLAARLDLLRTAPALRGASVGLQVVRLSDGKVLYQHDAEHWFVPASNMKLFTSALALMRLGPNFRFTTEVVAGQPIDASGSIHGDLVLVGGGDPSLSGRPYPYRYDPQATPGSTYSFAAIERFADELVAGGLKTVEGQVIGDDRRYVWEPQASGWTTGDALWDYGAPVSALIVNDNSFALRVRPSARPGDLASIWLTPPFEYFSIDNRVRTGSGPERKLRIERGPLGRELHLSGVVPAGDRGFSELLAVDDPAQFAAEVLTDALERRGVSIHGEAAARHRFADDDASPDASQAMPTVLVQRSSPPLSDLLQVVDKASQNLHAEVLLREVALARKQEGSRTAGLAQLHEFLNEIGLSSDCCQFNDGSGLSPATLVTPASVTALLGYMYKSKYRDLWLNLLPVAGSDGTLAARFAKHSEANVIHAKTGTLSHVHALSGYVLAPGHEPLAFALLVNNYGAPGPEVTAAMDRIALALAER
ncbi:MAG TPA: D-alanyl-D-alanine carboxypeptidase/D-alanyl-D-alanine-endopeptidase [Bryobacteraceae bacterium]